MQQQQAKKPIEHGEYDVLACSSEHSTIDNCIEREEYKESKWALVC